MTIETGQHTGYIAYLGEPGTAHHRSVEEVLSRVGIDLLTLNSLSSAKEDHGWVRKLLNLKDYGRSAILGTRNREHRQLLQESFREDADYCLLAYWGTNILPEIISIKQFRPATKIILNVLCHPMGLTFPTIVRQNLLFRFYSKYLDGIIFSTEYMKRYFHSVVSVRRSLPSLVLPPFLSSGFFPANPFAKNEAFPNIIFLGRMDWWCGQPTDNVLGLLNALMDEGIHVYHSDKTHSLPFHPFRHTFSPMNIKEVVSYATQFDASLLSYDLSKCRKHDRFRNTVPDRLITSVAAGLPIAIPRKGYEASYEYLFDYDAYISYDSPKDLREKLSDRTHIEELKRLAWKNREKYVGEAAAEKLISFIRSIV